jgi:hypothetical protein
MQNVITRKCINPEIQLYEHNIETGEVEKIYNYDEFCVLIDRWKILLIEKYDAKPGQTIFLQTNPNLFYYALFFAAAELGLIFIIDWPRVWTEDDLSQYKVTMHGIIDYVLIFSHMHTIGHPKQIHYWEIQRDLRFIKHVLCEDKLYDFDITQSTRITEIINTVWATPDSELLYSASSGTTGTPKKIVNTHKKVYLMAQRLADLYFTKNDSVLHYKNIHHGASMSYHFLPGFMRGGKQFTANGRHGDHTGLDPIVKFAVDNEINQLFLYSPEYLLYFLKNVPRVNHRLNIVTLYQITSDVVSLVKEKNINYIKSPFGDTTIGLGFFVKTVDQNTDIVNYDVTNMGPVLDDFFQIELRDGSLYVACRELEEDWRTSDDKFEVIDGNWHFRGRNNAYRIGEEWIRLNDIEQQTKLLFGPNGANIVVDFEMQKIYLAVWKENPDAESSLNTFFDQQYESVKISYVLRNEKYEHFFNSRKIDNSKIRKVCREKVKLTNEV